MAKVGDLGSLRVGVEIPIKGWNKNYGKITDDVKKYPKNTDKALDKANKSWGMHTKNLKAASLGMVAFGAATVTALGFAVNAAGDFQQSMVNTQSVVGATSEELQELTLFAREMGKQTVFSAKSSADAMYALGSAGLSTKEIMNSLKETLDLAAATNSELAFTSKVVASTLSQYGLEASEAGRISNVFAATISASQATMDKLATSMSLVGPVARSIGMSLEETTGILGSLFNAGLDASTAGTSLRQSIAQLLKPTDDAKEALKRLKVQTVDSGGNLRNLTDIIRDLETSGLSAADALTIFGVRAGPGMLALVSKGADAIEDLTEKVTGTNKAAEIAALQVETFQGQMKILKSAVSELQITIGNQLLPVLTEYTTKLSGIINRTSDWANENPLLTSTLVKLGGAVGIAALALGTLGFGALGAVKVAGVLKLMAVDVGILAGAIGVPGIATVGVAITLVAGLTALAFAFKGMISPSEDAGSAIEQFTENVWDSTKGLEANFRALKNVKVEAKALADIFPDLFTGTQIAGIKEFSLAAAVTEQTLNKVGERLLLIEESRKTDIKGQLARMRIVLESMGLESKAIDDQIKKEKQRLEEAIIGSKAHIAMLKRLESEMNDFGKAISSSRAKLRALASTGDAGAIAMLEILASKTKAVGDAAVLSREKIEEITKRDPVGTAVIQREADKQVAIIKQRTKWETDWIETNGIIQLGLVEKNVDEVLTLHGKETKEIKDARLKSAKEERKARDENLKEAVEAPKIAAKETTLELVAIGKDRDAALQDQADERLTDLKKGLDTSNKLVEKHAKQTGTISNALGLVLKAEGKAVDDNLDQEVAAGERRGKALVERVALQARAGEELKAIWKGATIDIKASMSNLFASMIDPSMKPAWKQFWNSLKTIAIKSLADIVASTVWQTVTSIGANLLGGKGLGTQFPALATGIMANLGSLTTTVSGVVASAAGVIGAAAPLALAAAGIFAGIKAFQAITGGETAAEKAVKEGATIRARDGRRLGGDARIGTGGRVLRGGRFGLTIGPSRDLSDEEKKVLRERIRQSRRLTAAERRARAGRGRLVPVPGAGAGLFSNIRGVPAAAPLPEPSRFTPRRPRGTDRFGRPVAATVAMAPAAPGRAGGAGFRDININVVVQGQDIRDMDIADWQQIFRDNLEPAAEAEGKRFVRSDNVLAS